MINISKIFFQGRRHTCKECGGASICEHKQLNMFNNFQPNSNNILLGDSGYDSNNIRNKL